MRGKTVKDQKRGKENRGLLTSLVYIKYLHFFIVLAYENITYR